LGAGEPAVDRRAERRLAAQPRGECHVGELDAEAAEQLAERAELVQLAKPVESVPGRRSLRIDELDTLDVAEHARRPARAGRRLSNRQLVHGRNLNTSMSGFGRPLAAVGIL